MINIKIACPENTVTGGIELLHQVACELNKYNDVSAKIWYIQFPATKQIPDEYSVYKNEVDNMINDTDVLIFPEIWAQYTNDIRYAQNRKFIYWESVDNYFPHTLKSEWYKFGKNTSHIFQSEYSKRFLEDLLCIDDIIEITDYINDEYLKCIDAENIKRQPIVLYNPAKGYEYTEKLIPLLKDIKFIPITGMTRHQIIELMKHSMLYIDLGHSPGKDRLPREAVACGLCIITSKRGAFDYIKDIDIPDWYQVSDINYAKLRLVANKIRDILYNFESHITSFNTYRQKIKDEKREFEKGVQQLVNRIKNEV